MRREKRREERKKVFNVMVLREILCSGGVGVGGWLIGGGVVWGCCVFLLNEIYLEFL